MRLLLTVPFALPLFTACMQEHLYQDPTSNIPLLDSFNGEELSFSGGGALSGTIGPVRGFQGTQNVKVEGYDDGVCTYVTIHGVGENGTGWLYVDLMPRVDELGEGTTGIGASEETYEGTMVTGHADADDGRVFDGNAYDGSITMVKHPDGTRELTIDAIVTGYDDNDETASTGVFRLQPLR